MRKTDLNKYVGAPETGRAASASIPAFNCSCDSPIDILLLFRLPSLATLDLPRNARHSPAESKLWGRAWPS